MPRKGDLGSSFIARRFDNDLLFLLKIDPAFERWRALAVEWIDGRTAPKYALVKFLVHYLHESEFDLQPTALFEIDSVPPLMETIAENSGTQIASAHTAAINDYVCDFLDWIILEKFGRSKSYRNPFTRTRVRNTGRASDVEFRHVVQIDPRMKDWSDLAAEWLALQRRSYGQKLACLNKFFRLLLASAHPNFNPYNYLRRDGRHPSYIELLASNDQNDAPLPRNTKKATWNSIQASNIIRDFFDWILLEKLSVDDEHGGRVIPHEYHNPIPALSKASLRRTETLKSSLPFRYIRELRSMLAEGPHFRDWKWAHTVMGSGKRGGDWLRVDPSIIDKDDPDCVWNHRKSTPHERNALGYGSEVYELWSPVRAVALYLKLELPLRTYQVRMLDSGEADTWRYVSGNWIKNPSNLSIGNERHPWQRGVFHRTVNEAGAGLYINTNKTADIFRSEADKGYVIPWNNEIVLYWLEKLRNWQEKYNPILGATLWSDLERKHIGHSNPHPDVLIERGATCFLFRDAAAENPHDRDKPMFYQALDKLWYRLLERMEERCRDRKETLGTEQPIRFVDPERMTGTFYPLHALRVSLITAYALDGGVPFPVLSKLIAGHARLIMTLYYTKAGKAHITEIMQEAEQRLFHQEAQGYRRFLMEKSYEEVERCFAHLDASAILASKQQPSAAGFIVDDKGICPVSGGLCNEGGELLINHEQDATKRHYLPVSGYPQTKNCVRCRFFLTGPAFLGGLVAHANSISYALSQCSARYVEFENRVHKLEDDRLSCEQADRLFTEHGDIERFNRLYEEEAEKANGLCHDLHATVRLIDRCIEIAQADQHETDGLSLVAAGGITDLGYAFQQTDSELYQLEVICENAVIFPEVDAAKATLRRSQILDAMLQMNGRAPLFFRLNEDQQLAVGNELMRLIKGRAGSMKSAVEFGEGKRLLADLGILDDATSMLAKRSTGVSMQTLARVTTSRQLTEKVELED